MNNIVQLLPLEKRQRAIYYW